MILAVDIGNTHIVLGALHEDSGKIEFTARISSDRRQTSDEYMVLLHNLFILNGFNLNQVEGPPLFLELLPYSGWHSKNYPGNRF